MKDIFDRKIEYLRISITDRCNFRCIYCMPEEGVDFIAHKEILTFDEIVRLVKIAVKLGIKKVKITGGEPLVRKGCIEIINQIKNIEGIEEVTLTTNGLLLDKYIDKLRGVRIDGINVSLDAVDRETFYKITRYDKVYEVLNSIKKSVEYGIKTKINSLIMPDINENEIIKLANIARDIPVHIRFIEVMPIGIGKDKNSIKPEEIKNIIENEYGKLIEYEKKLGNGPAKYYKLENFVGKIGFISAVSDCFCSECNRVRLTSTGFLKACLQYSYGIELKPLLRGDYSDEVIEMAMNQIIYTKPREHQFGKKIDFVKDTVNALDCGFNPKLVSEITKLLKKDDSENANMSSIGG